MYMEGLEKVRMNIYVNDSEKYKFIDSIYKLLRENDIIYNNCYVISEDMKEISEEDKKVADRVDRWLKVKGSVIPENVSFKTWRRVKIMEECKNDFKRESEKLKELEPKKEEKIEEICLGHRLLIQEIENDKALIPKNPFDNNI